MKIISVFHLKNVSRETNKKCFTWNIFIILLPVLKIFRTFAILFVDFQREKKEFTKSDILAFVKRKWHRLQWLPQDAGLFSALWVLRMDYAWRKVQRDRLRAVPKVLCKSEGAYQNAGIEAKSMCGIQV